MRPSSWTSLFDYNAIWFSSQRSCSTKFNRVCNFMISIRISLPNRCIKPALNILSLSNTDLGMLLRCVG
jgi:hypothetical protein